MEAVSHLLDDRSPPGVGVYRLTGDDKVPSSHVYMEAQVFTPDSNRFVLHTSATPHNSDRRDPQHRFLLCDLESGGELFPLTDEPGTTGPCVTPDGTAMIYFVWAESTVNGGRFELKRVGLDGTGRETLKVVDAPVYGSDTVPTKLYPLSTISSDGKRIAIGASLGDGSEENTDFGILVFDLEADDVKVVLRGPDYNNLHPQYCRSLDSELSHDLLIQHNHGMKVLPDGTQLSGLGPRGADVHVIRDDGTNMRDLPAGRDGIEYCQGHQCWRGTSEWVMVGIGRPNPDRPKGWGNEFVECLPADYACHIGRKTPRGIRNELCRSFTGGYFCHFQTDRAGERLVTDYGSGKEDDPVLLYLSELGAPGRDEVRQWRYLLNTRTTFGSEFHAHPFLSPDGTKAFFNSNQSGVLQAYMVTGLENLC